MVIFAAAKFRAAYCIKNRRSRTFCMVVAGFSCLEIPYGTALGVLSFVVFGRDSVVQLFKTGRCCRIHLLMSPPIGRWQWSKRQFPIIPFLRTWSKAACVEGGNEYTSGERVHRCL
jgi:hypothetical protein